MKYDNSYCISVAVSLAQVVQCKMKDHVPLHKQTSMKMSVLVTV